MKTKWKVSIVLMLLVALVITGCSQQEPVLQEVEGQEEVEEGSVFPREFIDGFGNTVVIEREIEKIISTAPSHTEILFALGVEDRIVGVSDLCNYPAEALEKESIGGYESLNVERIIELDPDIVFVFGRGDDDTIQQLEAVDIAIARYEPESIQEVLDTIASIASITGVEDRGSGLIEAMEEKRDIILEKVEGQETVRVFYEIWHEPLMAAGKNSFTHELITLAGGENVAAEAEGAYPIFSVETLVEEDPEFYLRAAEMGGDYISMTEEDLNRIIDEVKNRPGYGEITAIKQDNIYLFEPNIISRPGPRIIEALELIAEVIHPDVF